jgi:3-oxoacyl-[acyl-carrier protein] reductase
MENKIAVVTGAGSGIGQAIAVMFAKEGAKVVCANRKPADGEATVAQIKEEGGEAVYIRTDVTKKEDIKNLLNGAVDAYGKVDTLVNSAGILVHKEFLDHTDEDLENVYETNFRGQFWTMQEFLPTLIKNTPSSILNIASISVLRPESNAYAYGAMKAAINKMTRDLCREFSPAVRLNVLCPGPVLSGLTPPEVRDSHDAQMALVNDHVPMGRFGIPKDVAYAAVWLSSDEAEWVTGSTVYVDGGASNR